MVSYPNTCGMRAALCSPSGGLFSLPRRLVTYPQTVSFTPSPSGRYYTELVFECDRRVGQPRSSQRYFQRTFPERPAQEQKPTREKSPQQGRAPSRNKITHRRSCTSRTSSWHVLPQRGRRGADRLVQRIWCRIRRSCVCRFRVTFAATNYASALTSSNNSCHSPDSLALHLGFAPGFRIVTFPPHLLCNSPRLNDLASR